LVQKPESGGSNEDIRFLNLAEIDALIRAVPDDDLGRMEAVMYRTAAMTGIRQGECLGLRWRDVDWSAMRLRVRQSYVRGEYGKPKSKRSSRSVPLATDVARELERHFQSSAYQGDGDLVFCHPHTGRPYDRSKLFKRFKKALAQAQVGQFGDKRREGRVVRVPLTRFHDLRHTFGTTCAAAGIPLRTIMEWMGHRDIKTTMIYTDYMPGEKEAEWIERAFSEQGLQPAPDHEPAP
ncbi:MAG: site-specific integrase, partial [Solirubrobacterales bacterium]